jgi:hypothetical protein
VGVLAPPPHAAASASRAGVLAALVEDARDWCRGRSWIWRAPLVLAFAWAEWRRLRDPLYADWFAGITLGIHELGHLALFWAGSFLSISGGSLFQVAAPIAAGWILARQRDWFGITVAGAWLASSLHGLAAYVGDARARELPLVGLFPDPVHDWEWILGRLGILTWDRGLAAILRFFSAGIGIAAVAGGAWLCLEMARRRVGFAGRPPPAE